MLYFFVFIFTFVLYLLAYPNIYYRTALNQDIDSDIFSLTCLEVVDARRGFDKLAGVRLINDQFSDF